MVNITGSTYEFDLPHNWVSENVGVAFGTHLQSSIKAEILRYLFVLPVMVAMFSNFILTLTPPHCRRVFTLVQSCC